MKLVQASENRKIGKYMMAATYRPVGDTCPSNCPLIDDGCYAQRGRVGMCQQRQSSEIDYLDLEHFIHRAGREGRTIRYHVSGDLCTNGKPDMEYIQALSEFHTKHEAPGFGYTHAWREIDPLLLRAPRLLFNASCDTLEDVHEAKSMGWNTVVTVPPNTVSGSYEGIHITVCPSDRDKNITCADCRLCMKDRKSTVGFLSKNKTSDNIIIDAWTIEPEQEKEK